MVKVRNAAELLWDSLDESERRVVIYGLVYGLVAVVSVVQRRASERRARELSELVRSEVAAARGDG